MRLSALFVLLCVSMLAGCGFIPYKAPFRAKPDAVYVAKLSGALNSGSFKVILSKAKSAMDHGR
jgi:hypothetical protein